MDTQNHIFSQFRPEIQEGLVEYGVKQFSEEQYSLIDALKEGKDCFAKFNSGSGKTIAYLVGILERIDLSLEETQALVICPTRELSCNVKAVLNEISKHSSVRVVSLIGGESISDQRKELKNKPQVAVATPGRVMDFVNRQHLKLETIKTFVFDELDEMFSRGFSCQITDLLVMGPESTQIVFCSSTIPEEVEELKTKMMVNPVEIEGRDVNTAGFTVYSFVAEIKNKNELLLEILKQVKQKFLVFCAEDEIEEVTEFLDSNGLDCGALVDKELYFNPETDFTTSVLVLSDLNLEIVPKFKGISVINYNLPSKLSYLGRIAAKKIPMATKLTIQLVTPSEKEKLEEILSSIGNTNKEISSPSDIPL